MCCLPADFVLSHQVHTETPNHIIASPGRDHIIRKVHRMRKVMHQDLAKISTFNLQHQHSLSVAEGRTYPTALVVTMPRDVSKVPSRWRRFHFFDVQPIYDEYEGRNRQEHDSHGGLMSFSLSYFAVVHLMFLLTLNSEHTFCELGSARTVMTYIVKAFSLNARAAFAFENDRERCAYARLWSWLCSNRMRDSGFDRASIQHYLPRIKCADFTKDGDAEFDYHIRTRKMAFWANNDKGAWSKDNDVQNRLEAKIDSCKPGSLVLSFDRMFLRNETWSEEAITTKIKKRDLSWLGDRNNEIIVDKTFYRYIKLPRGVTAARGRNPPKARFVKYGNLNGGWRW